MISTSLMVDITKHPEQKIEITKENSSTTILKNMFTARYSAKEYSASETNKGNSAIMDEIFAKLKINIENPAELHQAYNVARSIAENNKKHPQCKEVWSTIGDLHGSSLKLMYFMTLQGIADINEDTYEKFVSIYLASSNIDTSLYKKNYKNTRDMVQMFNSDILPHIKVIAGAKIRLIGDEIGDRSGNDFLTLSIIKALIDGKADVEILLSNHAMDFIIAMEKIINGGSIEFKSGLNPGQFASAERLKKLIDNDLININDVKKLYESYKTVLKAFSYDYTPEGKLNIYSHAPVNELDILDIAENLVERYDKEKFITKPNTIYALQKLVTNLKNHNNMLQPEQITELIDLINSVVSDNATNNTLTKLVSISELLNAQMNVGKLNNNTASNIFNGTGVNPRTYGLHYATSNREDPNTKEAMARRNKKSFYQHFKDKPDANRPKNPDVIDVHGHTDKAYPHCKCLDNYLAKTTSSNQDILNYHQSLAVKPALTAVNSNSNSNKRRNM